MSIWNKIPWQKAESSESPEQANEAQNLKEKMDGLLDALEALTVQLKDMLLKMDIDEVAATYSKSLDEYILKQEETRRLSFVAGEFSVIYQTEEHFMMEAALYYKEGEQWIEEKTQYKRPTKYLKTAALAELREKKKIVFEINPPEKPADG